jgi:hypothetical protein
MEEEYTQRIKRFSIWAVIMIAIGLLTGIFLDTEVFTVFVDLLKTIITSLIV